MGLRLVDGLFYITLIKLIDCAIDIIHGTGLETNHVR